MTNLTDRMERVFQEVFENDELRLSDGMSQSTLPAWDSFAQVKLVIGLEEEFAVKFTTEEVVKASSVTDLKTILAAKGQAGYR